MVEDTINKIRQAEAEADLYLKEADSRCRIILKEASEKAEKHKEAVLKEARERANAAMEEAKKQGVLSTNAAAAEVKKNVKKLKETASRARGEEAVELVISRLV